MKLYDQIFGIVKQFKKLYAPGPVTNADVSGIHLSTDPYNQESLRKQQLFHRRKQDPV